MKNLRKNTVKLGLALSLGAAILPMNAAARSGFVRTVPNGSVNRCGTCHLSANSGGPRNAFGQDVEDNLSNGEPDWQAVYDLDSDGDGQTNGEELGDPCGDWTAGTAARTTDISNPGDNSSTTSAETVSCAGAPVEDAGPTEDAGAFVPDEDAGALAAADAGALTDADAGAFTDSDAGSDAELNGECSCASSAERKTPWMGLLAGIGLFFFRRKKKA